MMNIKEKTAVIAARLKELYPEVKCELTYNAPHELLIATRLSAQCTDKRVNLVAPALFERFVDVDAFADAAVEDIESLIRSCGLFKTKARDISNMCRIIKEKFSGKIPENLEDLLTLPGVGRKTANLIVGELFGKPAIVTDTHVIRLSNRLGLANSREPQKVETALRKIIPPCESLGLCHRLVWYGRRVCTARNPLCGDCVIAELCVNPPNTVKKP